MCRSKKETCSYLEILKTVGVDRPADILFVTDVFQEAVAAKAAGNVLLVVLKITHICDLCTTYKLGARFLI
jgi:methionine salvage enolase-phosphatase E1